MATVTHGVWRGPILVFAKHWVPVSAGNNRGTLNRPLWAIGPVSGWAASFGAVNDNRRSA